MYGLPKIVCGVHVIPVYIYIYIYYICSFHRFVCVCDVFISEVISSFKSFKAGSKVFALLV